MFKRVAILARAGEPRIRHLLDELIGLLERRGLEICLDSHCAEMLAGSGRPGIDRDCDLGIALGGDGTMLYAGRKLAPLGIPLLGINIGQLGFLADVSPDALDGTLARILEGEYLEEERFLIGASVRRNGAVVQEACAINDIVVQKWNIARLIRFETHIDGLFVNSQRADGVIVATPTGSTAYALSGGGPILHPALEALVLVPICPHTLSNRPLVVHADSEIEIDVGTREIDHARLTCDGELKEELHPGDRVLVRRSSLRLRLIHPPDHDHYAILRAKLGWG
ncbi:MAG: NAD(+) kinase [Gammaproteobacteria bacterium]|nr:MAG: NAD(+) kinase [Gammaproteobacteria bacterium]